MDGKNRRAEKHLIWRPFEMMVLVIDPAPKAGLFKTCSRASMSALASATTCRRDRAISVDGALRRHKSRHCFSQRDFR
jgi:hypothetical protein